LLVSGGRIDPRHTPAFGLNDFVYVPKKEQAPAMFVVTSTLAVLATLLAAFFGMTILNLQSSDAAGNALAEVWAFYELVVLWILLGALLAVRGFQGAFPGLSGALVLVLYLLAGAAQVASLRLVSQREVQGVMLVCLQLALMASPVLLLVRAGWTLLPSGARISPRLTVILSSSSRETSMSTMSPGRRTRSGLRRLMRSTIFFRWLFR
jgi:hypothetical protein